MVVSYFVIEVALVFGHQRRRNPAVMDRRIQYILPCGGETRSGVFTGVVGMRGCQ